MTKEVLEQVYYGNSVYQYLVALGCLIGGFIIVKIFQVMIVANLKKLASKTKTTIDDFFVNLIKKIILPLGYFGIFYLCVKGLNLNEQVIKAIQVGGIALLTYFAAHFIILLLDYSFDVYLDKRGREESTTKSLAGIVRVFKLLIWAVSISFFLDNLGFEISAVIAGLGIGGVAVALAAQAVLGDLFSYFSILFDRPFEVGDFIIVGDFLGTVERIGIKTTRLSSLGGEQLIFSNSDLTNSRVRNYKRMQKRRVVFQFGVTYQSSTEQCAAIPTMVQEIVNGVDHADIDRVHFLSFADSSLLYEVVYYVDSGDYNLYMDCQQAINLRMKADFENANIEFAYPTQTLYVSQSS